MTHTPFNGYPLNQPPFIMTRMNTPDQNQPTPGSPLWWAVQAQRRTKPNGRGRPSLPFDKIIATALELVEEIGYQSFNLRALADRLGSGTATLYRHFDSKDEILVYVADKFLSRLLAEDRYEGLSWSESCTLAATKFYQLLKFHPNVAPIILGQVPVGPNALAIREHLLSLLLDAGFEPNMAASAYTTIAHYVLGFASQLSSDVQSTPGASTELLVLFSKLDPELYPATIRSAKHLAPISIDDEFHFGLKLIIHGLECILNKTLKLN